MSFIKCLFFREKKGSDPFSPRVDPFDRGQTLCDLFSYNTIFVLFGAQEMKPTSNGALPPAATDAPQDPPRAALKSPSSLHRVFSAPPQPPPAVAEPSPPLQHGWKDRPAEVWAREHRALAPYWQHRDPVPPQPENPPELEAPGETLSERQEAFCRAYVERPVAAKAARLAGYSPASAAKQASKLLKHPAIVRRIFELRDVRGMDHSVRRDTIIDQAEAVFEASMEKGDYYAAMQALTMKARLAGFADCLPGVRILRREPSANEQEFWARTQEAEQRLMALRFGEYLGIMAGPEDVKEAKCEAEAHAESAGLRAARLAAGPRATQSGKGKKRV
jgi:hypothetical protein